MQNFWIRNCEIVSKSSKWPSWAHLISPETYFLIPSAALTMSQSERRLGQAESQIRLKHSNCAWALNSVFSVRKDFVLPKANKGGSAGMRVGVWFPRHLLFALTHSWHQMGRACPALQGRASSLLVQHLNVHPSKPGDWFASCLALIDLESSAPVN